MPINSVVISSGHGLYVRGAAGIIDEVDTARSVVERLAVDLKNCGVDVVTYHDDVSYTQSENLNRIADFHNSKIRDLDISVHFNAYEQVEKPMGVEVLYVSQKDLAAKLSEAIASAGGFIDRGAKYRDDLFFLNSTSAPAVLLEVCFVDSEADCKCLEDNFDFICQAIATSLSNQRPEEIEPPAAGNIFRVSGRASKFGGPDDTGVDADEGLAFISDVEDAPQLFLPFQPEDTTGLARRLNPYTHYVACRWDYDTHPKGMLLDNLALVRSLKSGVALVAFPADWGPHQDTGRVADLSPSLLFDLGLDTDDDVEVIFPYYPP